jgi:hypothetical protein
VCEGVSGARGKGTSLRLEPPDSIKLHDNMHLNVPLFFRFCALMAILGLCSCSRPVDGQVFVVTSGAGNYKLGLVPILLLTQSDFEKARTDFAEELESLRSSKQEQLTRAQEQVNTLSKAYEEASRKSDASKKRSEEAAQKLASFTASDAVLPSRFDGNPDTESREALQRFIRGLQSFSGVVEDQEMMARMSDVPKSLFQQLKTRLEQLTGTANPDPNAIAGELTQLAKNYYTQWKQLDEAYEKQRRIFSPDIDATVEAQNRLKDATDAAKRAEAALELTPAETFTALKNATSTFTPAAKTDGDGKFRLPDIGAHKFLVAYGERTVGTDTERYCWIIDLAATNVISKANELILSNDNLASPEELVSQR